MGHVIGLYSQNISIITCLNCKSPIHPIIILLPSSAKGTALPNPLQQKPRNCKAKSQHPECFLLPTPTLYGFDLHPGWASQLTSYSHLIPLHPEATGAFQSQTQIQHLQVQDFQVKGPCWAQHRQVSNT